ncbi:hypothetical protein FRUB_07249 [Fimbriiglobus ruber]|uniref:Uncharacterized protein n=1 Tax=Fimbriiglobus ruber TaxID=1908690 RepID=A0A225DLP7_9BACT|nr:hypothetical protein FRUB_07249 [Fimbriiglobus ruber]
MSSTTSTTTSPFGSSTTSATTSWIPWYCHAGESENYGSGDVIEYGCTNDSSCYGPFISLSACLAECNGGPLPC